MSVVPPPPPPLPPPPDPDTVSSRTGVKVLVVVVVLVAAVAGGAVGWQYLGGDADTGSGATPSTTASTIPSEDALQPVNPLDAPASIPTPPPEEGLDPVSGVLSGGPDLDSAESFTQVLTEGGLDITGVEVWVWPITGSDGVLLILNIDDSASGLLEDPGVASKLGEALLSPVLDAAGVTQLVINYRSSDEQGPFTLMVTFLLDALRDGADLSSDDGFATITRG